MSHTTTKHAKLLRAKAQEFLASRRNCNQLVEIMRHFESGADTSACLVVLEMIFSTLLREHHMHQEIVPLRLPPRTSEQQYIEWLRSVYDDFWRKTLDCLEHPQPKIQLQALSTAMKLLAHEGQHPLETWDTQRQYLPASRLKSILMKLLLQAQPAAHLIAKYAEHFAFDDVQFLTWKSLPSITAKSNPSDAYIMNYLLLLEKLPLPANHERQLLASDDQFVYDQPAAAKCVNKIWNCVMQWEHNKASHKQLLVVLLERVLPHLEKPLAMTDFLMDSLDCGGATSILALQGILTMIQVHNLDYPNIFAKLYSMFEPEIFHDKFKSRLFYLADMFLSSTHLPENMVAAFAKRLARLALVAPSEDVVIICIFIGNLIIRHPGLKRMINHPTVEVANDDTYIMEERDPLKSNAISSSLWELRTLQNHALPKVAMAARVINELPSVERDLARFLNDTSDDIFDREIKRHHNLIAMAFDRPDSLNLRDIMTQYWSF